MVEHPVIFDAMYKIVTFGHGGVPHPGRFIALDPSDDFFRIRLVAIILETCGVYFTKGAAGKKLDHFLYFFQYYIYTKQPLPMDIEFIVTDVFALTRPNWQLATSYDEAVKAFQQAVANDQRMSGADKAAEAAEVDDASSVSSDDDEDGDPDLPEAEADGDEDESGSEDDIDDEDNHGSAMDSLSVSEDEAIVVTRQEQQIDPEAEADFEREYAKMMAESLESRKFERKPLFDVPLPVRGKTKEASSGAEPIEPATSGPGPTMAFSLLTKKGNRQQTRTVEVPSDSNFAVAMKNQQQVEREEQQRIKNLVLNYDLRENEEQDGTDRPSSHHHNRVERGKERIGQRSRKLQLSDVDWT
ncbi:Regulator of nonsense transcripts UPF2 like protein [Verticillium longisporum]|nr:Regulator of nonsense transcripts UPF2 like protein [Verticillium longisporum]